MTASYPRNGRQKVSSAIWRAEQFPTALRGRGHLFGEAFGRIFSGPATPFLMAPFTGSPMNFFGTMLVVAAIGAFIPVVLGRETIGQLEIVTETAPKFA